MKHENWRSTHRWSKTGRVETNTRLKPSATIEEDDPPRVPRYGDLAEPEPSGGRHVIPADKTKRDLESFEDSDAARWRDEH
jgi:hypothetical protein